MKARQSEILTIVLFCGFLAAAVLGYILLPGVSFSPLEKRNLAKAPELSWDSVRSGAWSKEAETYMADHMPGRTFFVGLNAYFELLTGRQAAKAVWIVDHRLVEAPVQEDSNAIRQNMDSINRLAQTVEQEVHLAIVPSAGWSTGKREYRDDSFIRSIYAQSGEQVSPIDLTGFFEGRPELYYRTDHHWNSAGAYEGCLAMMEQWGRPYPGKEEFRVTTVPDFYGSTYSRSGLWLTPGEDLELWQRSDDLQVTNEEAREFHNGVFYRERTKEADKYTVFLDGNHSLVRIHNPNGQGKLLVVRDSFSNCLGCFLAESFQEVVLVDLRYYKQPISQLIVQESFDHILVCYSLSNFLTDSNLVFLR